MAELIAFTQYKLGGVQNFYYNLLSHAPLGLFDIRWIYEDVRDGDPPLPKLYGVGDEIIFPVSVKPGETTYAMAKRLQANISNKPGVILANFPEELATLHLYRRSKKTIFFICHDIGYVSIAERFEFLIDVFIAHNIEFYDLLIKTFPNRRTDIHFIPYGVPVAAWRHVKNFDNVLRIVIAARLVKLKGVYDIPVIDDLLKKKNLVIEWTIIGEGPEKQSLEEMLLPRGNFSFYAPSTTTEVLAIMQKHDIFILPSRWKL
jgi:glycosyltransferase involved in cell wall biosynthesis